MSKILNRLWGNPWLLLALCITFWASNVVASRLAAGHVSPFVLSSARWAVACLILLPFFWRELLRERDVIRQNWLYLVLMSSAGFTVYTWLFYGAGNFTSGVNISMLVSLAPVFAFAIAWACLGMNAGPIVLFALALTMAGALTVATRGDLAALKALNFNAGDLMMIGASFLHGAYTVFLRNRPALSSISFFLVLIIVAMVSSIPALFVEYAAGAIFWPTLTGWILVIYVGVFPTILSMFFYMRGVELIGPHRTSLFYNLTPVLGAFFAVTFLGEPFALYHGAGFALVICGIVLAERWRARQPA